jgi:Domain of Unknown Function (DUF1206)
MASRNLLPKNIKQPVQQAASHPWIERLARLGYAAKGVVYFVVGLLAAQAAFGSGGKTTDTSGALKTIVIQPFGKFLLSIVALGLIGYALWRLVQTILDPEHAGHKMNAKLIVQRLGYAFSAFAYAGLAVTSVKLIIGSHVGESSSIEDWTSLLLVQPFGQWLVGMVGVIVICVGAYYIYEAYKGKFRRQLKLHEMTSTQRTWTMLAGRFGIASRGVVFGIIGIFFIQAARLSEASETKGLGEALRILIQQPYGAWILGVVASGLIAYGVYSVIQARYWSINNS